jgi:curved DNA-binding protein CbpA
MDSRREIDFMPCDEEVLDMKDPWQIHWKDYYEVLQIIPSAESEVIEGAYKRLAAKYHPDNKKTGDAEKFRLIREAHETLANPVRKKEYDAAYRERLKNNDPCQNISESDRGENSRRPVRPPTSKRTSAAEDSNPSGRIFCGNGSCTGVINKKGVCTVCGKAYVQESQRKINEPPEKRIIDQDI